MLALKIILWAAAIWCACGFVTIGLRLSEKIWIPRGEILATVFVACVLGPIPLLIISPFDLLGWVQNRKMRKRAARIKAKQG